MTTDTLFVPAHAQDTSWLGSARQAWARHRHLIRRTQVHHHLGRYRYGFCHRGVVASLVGLVCVCLVVVASASGASLPDGRGYELVSPPDLQGASLWSTRDDSLPLLPESWGAVAADGNAVLWRIVAGGPSDAQGLTDVYRSMRGRDGSWRSQFAGPPAGVGLPVSPTLQFATPSLDRLLWLTVNVVADPFDHDPVEAALAVSVERSV